MYKKLLSISHLQLGYLRSALVKRIICIGFFLAILFLGANVSIGEPTVSDLDGDGVANADDVDDDNDGIPDSEECKGTLASQFSILNGGFETPDISGSWSYVGVAEVEGWSTTSSYNIIEIWTSGFQGIDAYEGNQFAELNARSSASNYQVINSSPGDVLYWSFAHRGRASSTVADVMQIEIGPEGGAYNYSESMSDTKSSWGFYSGTYTVPAGQTETRFALTAISTASGNISVGNFVDDFQLYSLNNCLADIDGDGIVNSEDLDSDGDGIMDIIEAGGVDLDKDGRVDYQVAGDPSTMLDDDNDGLMDDLDNIDNQSGAGEVTNGTPLPFYNSDATGSSDYLDIDADDDGIVDNTEFQGTKVYISPTGSDDDGDGIDNAYDIHCNPCGAIYGQVPDPIDMGGTLLPDYRDTDSDGDGILDIIEGHDTNGDGIVDGDDSPYANTGKLDNSNDTDGDGLLDGFDNDSLVNDPTNGGSSASSYPKNDPNSSDMDWRSVTVLPLRWQYVEVERKGPHAKLNWATALELNNEFFEIQRSSGGKPFKSIGTIKARATRLEIAKYNFLDKGISQLSDTRIFYRIKQVNYDGKSSFSTSVELRLKAIEKVSIEISPNPSQGQIRVWLEFGKQEAPAFLSLCTLDGKEIIRKKLRNRQELVRWNLKELPPGNYLIKWNAGDRVFTKKFILN
ncbi:MAG: T9SS type A sorting domain-containing protein [Bacteroidota bacterium]